MIARLYGIIRNKLTLPPKTKKIPVDQFLACNANIKELEWKLNHRLGPNRFHTAYSVKGGFSIYDTKHGEVFHGKKFAFVSIVDDKLQFVDPDIKVETGVLDRPLPPRPRLKTLDRRRMR